MVMFVDGIDEQTSEYLAIDATYTARQRMPRVSGLTASRLTPISGKGFFGVYFPDRHAWFQEKGTKAFTMTSLAGKTIPMWIDDVDGSARTKNPKAKVRRTQDGRTQILIFRRAAPMGQRRVLRHRNAVTGMVERSTTPASYPGAPGRIANRAAGMGWEGSRTPALEAGQVARGNVGVRWRHPGLRSTQNINAAIATVAFRSGLLIETIYACDGASLEELLKRDRRVA